MAKATKTNEILIDVCIYCDEDSDGEFYTVSDSGQDFDDCLYEGETAKADAEADAEERVAHYGKSRIVWK